MVTRDFADGGPLITMTNYHHRSSGSPYNATVHQQVNDGVTEIEFQLTYKGQVVKRAYGLKEDIPILFMAAINEHQNDLAKTV